MERKWKIKWKSVLCIPSVSISLSMFFSFDSPLLVYIIPYIIPIEFPTSILGWHHVEDESWKLFIHRRLHSVPRSCELYVQWNDCGLKLRAPAV